MFICYVNTNRARWVPRATRASFIYSQIHVTTNGQSIWDPLSDEKAGLSFTVVVVNSTCPIFTILHVSTEVKVTLWPMVIQPVSLGAKPHLGPRIRFLSLSDLRFCPCEVPSLMTEWVAFSAVKISSTYHIYLQVYMLAFYIVSCHVSGSLWIATLYSFTCNCGICSMYNIHKASVSLGLAQQIMP
jgi:hypothetical protein